MMNDKRYLAELKEEQDTMQWITKLAVPVGLIIFVASLLWTVAMMGA